MLDTHILFVCTGNTCRSPMARAIAESAVKAHSQSGISIEVDSAGVMAEDGYSPTQEAVDTLAKRSIDLKGHKTKALSVELIDWADVVYTMTPMHALQVVQMSPGSKDKVFSLDGNEPITDPIGQSIEVYGDVADQLERLINEKIEEIIT